MKMIKEIHADKLTVKVFETRTEMGECASREAAARIKALLAEKSEINMIFAAAPSQNETLAGLVADTEIDWSRVNAFHMDEYVGLPADAPQTFGSFLREHIFDRAKFKSVYYISEAGKTESEICENYAALIKAHPIDVVCLGIGENGHIAFNDPWVADFNDPSIIKRVELDEVCRNQQVNDGCFARLDDVPRFALTLTVPALLAADYLFCTVPAKTKAWAVCHTVNDEISEKLPATVMRKHKNAVMYCDRDSAAEII